MILPESRAVKARVDSVRQAMAPRDAFGGKLCFLGLNVDINIRHTSPMPILVAGLVYSKA